MKNERVTEKDYPLYKKRPDLIKTPTGKSVDEINIENVISGKITPLDCRISEDTLEYQAQIAESAGSLQIAENFRRAAELTRLPDNRILEIYNCMRPYNSTAQELLDIADELEKNYNAVKNAAFLRETVAVYTDRKLFRA